MGSLGCGVVVLGVVLFREGLSVGWRMSRENAEITGFIELRIPVRMLRATS